MNLMISPTRRAWTSGPKAFTLALSVLAATAAFASQEKLASSIGTTRAELTNTREQLQATVDAIDALVKQKEGDLRPGYQTFVNQVTNTTAAALTTKRRADTMQTEAQSHFGGWQKEIDGIANNNLRKKAQTRMVAVEKSYTKTVAELGAAANSFSPLLSDLNDMKKMLANDLTPGGVKAIRRTVSQAKFNLQAVRTHIADALKELERMQASLSTTAKK